MVEPAGELPRLPICPANGSTRCTNGDRKRPSCSTWISSKSPTYGEQEGSAYNGHFGCTHYHPLFVFNQFGRALRPAAGQRTQRRRLVRGAGVIARYRGTVKRLYFRGDAAFEPHRVFWRLQFLRGWSDGEAEIVGSVCT